MAHFAKIEENIVTFVTVGRDDDDELILSNRTGEIYRKTSYNTIGGIHYKPQVSNNDLIQPSEDQSKAFRKNFAGVGYTYDETRDAFIPPQPHPSWLLDEDTCLWNPPIPMPDDDKLYEWVETAPMGWKLTNHTTTDPTVND
jgi:hypothetical protein